MTQTADTEPPIRPRELSTQVEEDGDALRLTIREGEWGLGCFLALWLTGWTVGCVVLIGIVLVTKDPFAVLFALPFQGFQRNGRFAVPRDFRFCN